MKRSFIAFLTFGLISGLAFTQDLKIDYRFNVAASDKANYFTFSGPIRYMAADKDTYDAATGASIHGSTHLFQPYLLDVKGNNTLPNGLRGLFLFAVAADNQRTLDNLNVRKAANGVITIQFAHRGSAYGLITDSSGKLNFPKGNYWKRVIGYIQGANPQVISKDFSSNGAASGIDWAKVWNPSTPDGKEIAAGVATKTGKMTSDNAADNAMFGWSGSLQVTFDKNILTITGGLNAVKK